MHKGSAVLSVAQKYIFKDTKMLCDIGVLFQVSNLHQLRGAPTDQIVWFLNIVQKGGGSNLCLKNYVADFVLFWRLY